MILGVLSDTHGNRTLMVQVADRMVNELGAERLIHLGDDYDDAEMLMMMYPDVWAVPGLWCAAYRDGRTPKRIREQLDGLCIVAAHADQDLPPIDSQTHLVLTGHTHRAEIAWSPPVLRVNPGHLKRPVDRGEAASFAMVHIEPGRLYTAIYEVDGILRKEVDVDRTKNA